MAKCLSDITTADYGELQTEMMEIRSCICALDAAQRFVDRLYERFCDSLVLLRLFTSTRYGELPEDDRQFVDRRANDTRISHLIHNATPILTLLGTRGRKKEWNDRRNSQRFRCLPLASTSFVASLSMLSRQFESMRLELGLFDNCETEMSAKGRANNFCGMLCVRDSASDKDKQGRMIVPMQEFVLDNNIKSTVGFGSGYRSHPSLVTLFAFTNEELSERAMLPFSNLLEAYVLETEWHVEQGRIFEGIRKNKAAVDH